MNKCGFDTIPTKMSGSLSHQFKSVIEPACVTWKAGVLAIDKMYRNDVSHYFKLKKLENSKLKD
jgi:hypothetical protein